MEKSEMQEIPEGLFGWAKEAQDSVKTINEELKRILFEVTFYSNKEKTDEEKESVKTHAENLKKMVGSLRDILAAHISMPENIDVNPFLADHLDDKPVSQGVYPAPEFGEKSTIEPFDYERPPFKLYYLPKENQLIYARLKGEGSRWPHPEIPDFDDTREVDDERWCRYANLLTLQLTRILPEDLQKEMEVYFGQRK